MNAKLRLFRFWLGRHLIHAGLRAMPPGVARDQITGVLDTWGRHVRETIARDAQSGEQ